MECIIDSTVGESVGFLGKGLFVGETVVGTEVVGDIVIDSAVGSSVGSL